MATYLFQVNYVGKGVEGLMKDGGSSRREAGRRVVESVGGTLESFYFTFGDADAIGIVDLPDVASAVAASMKINASDRITIKLTPLITVEEVDAATEIHPSSRPPGE